MLFANSGISPIKNGNQIIFGIDKAENLQDYFSSVYGYSDGNDLIWKRWGISVLKKLVLMWPLYLVYMLNRYTPPLDGISSIFIEANCCNVNSSSIYSIKTKVCCTYLKKCITSVHKSGSKPVASIYRPRSLTPIPCGLSEKMIKNGAHNNLQVYTSLDLWNTSQFWPSFWRV